jgi:hypothetical protein
MQTNELKRGNADRLIFRDKTDDLDHFAIKQMITGDEAHALIDQIGMDLDKVSQAAEKLKAAARTTLSPQGNRHSFIVQSGPLRCRGPRVLDLDPMM